MSKTVSVITVNWNTARLIDKLMDSLLEFEAEIDLEVVVVDNNSDPDDSNYLKMLCKRYKSLAMTIIKNNANIGYAEACNFGVDVASGEYLAFIHPDAYLTEPMFAKLIKRVQEGKKIGVIGSKILSESGETVLSAGRANSIMGIAAGAKFLPPAKEGERFVDWVLGAFLFTKKPIFDELGGFDPRFFMYAEDSDYCLKAKSAGYRVLYFPEVEVVHFGRGSAQKDWDRSTHQKMHSEFVFFTKWRGKTYALANAFFNGFVALKKSALKFVWSIFGGPEYSKHSDMYLRFGKYRLLEFAKHLFGPISEESRV